MNYLAHVLLSGPDADWQLGGYLGDFVKGPLGPQRRDRQGNPWSVTELAGMGLHRRIDAWIDRQPAYLDCIALLGPEYRRVGGIAMDVFFDHLLARYWDNYVDSLLGESLSLAFFSQQFYRHCLDQSQRLPTDAERFIRRAAEHDLFQGYADRDIYLPVLQRIDQRIRFNSNLARAGEVVMERYTELEQRFSDIMPQLAGFAASQRGGTA